MNKSKIELRHGDLSILVQVLANFQLCSCRSFMGKVTHVFPSSQIYNRLAEYPALLGVVGKERVGQKEVRSVLC